IPVVERSGEVLKKQQGKPWAGSEATVSVGLVAHLQELGWGGRVAAIPFGRHGVALLRRDEPLVPIFGTACVFAARGTSPLLARSSADSFGKPNHRAIS